MTFALRRAALAALVLFSTSSVLRAEEAVSVDGSLALLEKPKGKARVGVVLIPGGDGYMGIREDGSFAQLGGNQLVRTRKAYAARGLAVLTIERGVNPAAAVTYLKGIAPRVLVVGTSRGTLSAPRTLPARPDAWVLTSGFLDDVRAEVGDVAALPRTLVVHHRADGCRFTPPAGVEPFKAWGGAKVSVVWMEGGRDEGNPCQAGGHHGFAGLDGQVVSTVARFALSGR